MLWNVLMTAAAVGCLGWGLVNAAENRHLRARLAKFDRVKGKGGRFVSKSTPFESWMAGK